MNQPIFKNVCVGFGEGVEEVNKFYKEKRRTCMSKNGGGPHPTTMA